MGINAILDTLDELPEEIKSFYKEADGKFILDVDGLDDHPNVRGVINANKTNKQTRDKLKEEVAALKKRIDGLPEDFDASAYQELVDAAEGKGGKPTDEQVQELREKIRAKLEPKYTSEIQTRDERISKLDGALRKMIVDGELSKAMDKANIDGKHKAMLLPYLKSSAKIEVEEDGDAFKAAVDTDMGPVSIEQFVSDWAASDNGKIYVAKPTGPSPKGGGQGGAGQKTVTRAQFDAMSQFERSSFSKDGGKIVDG